MSNASQSQYDSLKIKMLTQAGAESSVAQQKADQLALENSLNNIK